MFAEEVDLSEFRKETAGNRLICGDNLDVLNLLLEQGYSHKIDLIYIDPPFLSDSNYNSRIVLGAGENRRLLDRFAFQDSWEHGLDFYLEQMYERLLLMKELLSDQGSIFVHLDWHVSHYVKLLLDEIFNSRNFINEIVWCYGGGSGSRRHFHRKHDLIFWYACGNKYIFNPQYRPYSEGTLQRGLTRVKGDKYRLHEKGALMQDWWTDINKILSPTARENLKFPTQKPAALLKRIISAASHPGSLVADFYSGSGTTAEVCEQMGRKWIACDNSQLAIQTALNRLAQNEGGLFKIEAGEGKLNQNDEENLSCHALAVNYNDENVKLYVSIDNYRPPAEYTSTVKTGLSWDTLVDFWEIDLDYDGEIFRSDIQIVRKRSAFNIPLALDIEFIVPQRSLKQIALKVNDIFGSYAIKKLELS